MPGFVTSGSTVIDTNLLLDAKNHQTNGAFISHSFFCKENKARGPNIFFSLKNVLLPISILSFSSDPYSLKKKARFHH